MGVVVLLYGGQEVTGGKYYAVIFNIHTQHFVIQLVGAKCTTLTVHRMTICMEYMKWVCEHHASDEALAKLIHTHHKDRFDMQSHGRPATTRKRKRVQATHTSNRTDAMDELEAIGDEAQYAFQNADIGAMNKCMHDMRRLVNAERAKRRDADVCLQISWRT